MTDATIDRDLCQRLVSAVGGRGPGDRDAAAQAAVRALLDRHAELLAAEADLRAGLRSRPVPVGFPGGAAPGARASRRYAA